jgi:hypothetical protein
MGYYTKDPLIEGANLNFAKFDSSYHRDGTRSGGSSIRRGHTERDDSAFVQAYCGDITPSLVERINQYDVVLACCAWLTNVSVLDAMADCKHAMAIVQKEDFLRPDRGQVGDWKARLRQMYDRLPGADQYQIADQFSYCSSWGDKGEAVRCVGVVGDRNRVTPKMHHKFFVFCDLDGNRMYAPRAVWTGSLNASANAERSRENAVYIESKTIARHYFAEFVEMIKISEDLDWTSPWIDPGLREGS